MIFNLIFVLYFSLRKIWLAIIKNYRKAAKHFGFKVEVQPIEEEAEVQDHDDNADKETTNYQV